MSAGTHVSLPTGRERARSLSDRVALSADAVAVLALGLMMLGLAYFTWRTWGNLQSDTGYDFVAGARVAHGDVPYVDFTYYYGPLPAALLGLAAWIGGDGVSSYVVLGLIVTAAIVALTYVLGRRLTGPVGGFLAAAITMPVAFAPHLFNFVLPYSTGATLGILTVLVMLVAIEHAGRVATSRAYVAVGLAAGLVALTKPEFEAAALVALVAWLLIRDGADRRRAAALALGSALLVPAVVYGAFLGWVSPHRLVLENLYPKAFLSEAGNAVLKVRLPLTASSGAKLVAETLLYAGGVALLLLAARAWRRSSRPTPATPVSLAIGALVALLAAIVRPELLRHALQFAYAWIPLGVVVCLVIVVRRARARDDRGADTQLVVAVGAALAILAASEYAAFYLQSASPQIAIYTAPLAALFLVRLQLRGLGRSREVVQLGVVWLAFLAAAGLALTIHDARAESATVRGPGGTLHAAPGEAQVYGAAIRWLGANTARNDAVLFAPQLSWLYTVADRSNPLPEISLLPGVFSDAAAQRAAIRKLDEAGVRAAIVDPRPYSAYGQTSFGRSFDRLVADWLRANFRLRGTLHPAGAGSPTLQLWLRRAS